MGSRDTEPSNVCGGCRDRTDRKGRQGNGRRRGHPSGNGPQGCLPCRRVLPDGQHGKGGGRGKDPRHGGQGADQPGIAYNRGTLGVGAGWPAGRYPLAPRAFILCLRSPRAHDHEERQHLYRCSLSGSRGTASRPCLPASPGFEGNRSCPNDRGAAAGCLVNPCPGVADDISGGSIQADAAQAGCRAPRKGLQGESCIRCRPERSGNPQLRCWGSCAGSGWRTV